MAFTFRLLTQEGLVTETKVSSVTLQAIDGQIGILQGHADYIGVLGEGPLTLVPDVEGDGIQKKYVTRGGFCQVTNGNLEVLADGLV